MGISQPALDHRATVPALIRHSVSRFGDNDLVVTESQRVTYRQADAASQELALRMLAWGVGKGTRVATMFPYGVEWLITWLAVERIGAVHIPLSTAFKAPELRKALLHSDAGLLIVPARLFGSDHQAFVDEAVRARPEHGSSRDRPVQLPDPGLPYLRTVWFDGNTDRPWATSINVLGDETAAGTPSSVEVLYSIENQVTPADTALVIYTSGTTSEPKGVCHTHGALVRKGAHLAALQEWTAEDRIFCGMPFFWVGGVAMTVVPAIVVGATLLCIDRTEPLRSLDLMERERATVMTGWPGVRGPIDSHPTRPGRDIPALSNPSTNLFAARHGSLGMTETLASYSYAVGADREIPVPEGHTGSMGPPIDGADVRIADPEALQPLAEGEEGAILVRGYFLTVGLYKREREETFTRDGYYVTGDKGYLLGGLLFLTGRLTELIKTSGNNVAPPEVEAVLGAMPEIRVAHVLGIPDPDRGEIVAALVVAEEGCVIDGEQLREKARAQLSNFKVPRKIVVVSEGELPWLATGKPDRLSIRRMLQEAPG